MRKILLLICFQVVALGTICAQNAQRAESLFQDGKYADAMSIYQLLHKRDASHPLYTYRLARCKQELGYTEEAINLFVEAGTKYNLRNFFLGELYFQTYRFEQSQEMYKAYLENIDGEEERYDYTLSQLSRLERLIRYFRKMEDVSIIDSVSTEGNTIEACFAQLSPEIGTFTMEDGLATYTNPRGDRRFMTITDQNGRSILCKQEKLLEEWSPLDTLPLIVNQNEKQNYPFLMSDGMTLYFASSSQNGLGGWDIYVTRFNTSTNSYIKPELANMPFNSLHDDILLGINENTGKGMFASNRSGRWMIYTFVSTSEKATLQGENDNYRRDYARLIILRTQETEDEENIAPEHIIKDEVKKDFCIVINDSTIYHSLSDFRSEETKTMAENYLDILQQIEEETEELSSKRDAYKKAESAEEKQSLTPLILVLEKDIIRLKKESTSLLREIRHQEK